MRITVCRLHAGRNSLAERAVLRGARAGPADPGDALKGQSAARLRQIAAEAAADAEALEGAAVGDLRVDTDGRTVPDIAREVVRHLGWSD
ncbi:hypothetical protein O7626_14345 [Micromonospora sp. WMMD1102]|uniref:hypothetical protein n=1 Tax=Micromonospora sp. WMMD1102 TaxID=3016105 RepID=UPI00241514DE|nr:hypothetical protein [Micromonospora sp. WMMD1102]MDG4787094.1 hypothetical protein [Micromonospora sp. WMMD1102]